METFETGIGLDVVLWFQAWRGPVTTALFRPFNAMGTTLFYLSVLPLLYWCVDARLGRRANLLFLGAAWANGWLKDLWARPRPFQVSTLVQPGVEAHGFGLPSGHTMMATVLWGAVAAWSRKPLVVVMLVAYIVLMGLSRVVEGVHYPQDVIVGWLLGGAFVAFYVWALPRIEPWLTSRGLGAQVALAAGVAGAMILVFPLLSPLREAGHYQNALTAAASFFGSATGFALEVRFVGFSARGALSARVLRFALGVLAVMGLSFGLKALTASVAPEPGILEGALRFFRYTLVGLFIALGAPWMFVRLGLAERCRPSSRRDPLQPRR
jgi:membrane-associated phospholipid phosphatase